MKIFQVLEHCSTGGMPAYALKQVQQFEDQADVTVFEVKNYSDLYTVQRKQFKNLVQLHSNQPLLLSHIQKHKPDIIHFQELPETYLDQAIIDRIYTPDRSYKIIVTTHGSSVTPKDFKYIPDRIVAVCKWQQELFQKGFTGVDVDLWEYPIENRIPTEQDRIKAKEKLGISKHGKQILNVGLFTPGKNQGELFDIARQYPDNTYHFVGNQAENFKSYWANIMANKPKNCRIWGERDDVDLFYKACDELYFTSKHELFPLVVREALSYGLPVKMYKLPTYSDEYDNEPLIEWLNQDNKVAFIPHKKPKIQVKHLLTDGDPREAISIPSIEKLIRYGIDYTQMHNDVYNDLPPKEHCRRPEHIGKSPGELYPGAGLGYITGRHYGCYMAHVKALQAIDGAYDYTLIMEADAVIQEDVAEFVSVIHRACRTSVKNHVYYISFANNASRQRRDVDDLFVDTGTAQDTTHCYLIPNRYKAWYLDRIEDCEWDSPDLWYNHVFHKYPKNRYTTKKVYCIQTPGKSLLDEVSKEWAFGQLTTINQ